MKIFIVIPCYNEEAVLPKTLEVLGNLIKNIKVKTDADTELLLVDDGSRDRTWQMISNAAKEHRYVHGIKLSHNRGHQNALWAGMEAAVDHCDAMVSIDADLQDDENVIIDMVQQVQEGKDIIYGVRKERKTKYPLTKMLSFSIDGITSFSVAPLRFITFLGLAMTLVAFVMIIFALVEHFQGKTIQGWTSMLVSMWFIGGIITTGVGITGVYIGKIYTEVKRRPRYFIEERV